MYAQGIEWDLLCALEMSNPGTFQELATKAHDMEMTIANRRSKSSSSYEFKKDKGPRRVLSLQTPQWIVSIGEPVRILGEPGQNGKEPIKKRATLKELQERKCPFPDLDLLGMLDDLLKTRSLNSTELKQPENARRTND